MNWRWQLSEDEIRKSGDTMLLAYHNFLFRFADELIKDNEEDFITIYKITENEILRRMKGEH